MFKLVPAMNRRNMDLENISEINKANLPKLEHYWTYLDSYRKKIEETELISTDISLIFKPYPAKED